MSIVDIIISKFKLSPNRELIAKNVIWSLMGKVITLLGNLFVGIIIARYLGAEKYGLMNYVISYVTLFQIIASFGLDNIEIREEAKADVKPEVVIGTAFRIRIIFTIITVFVTIVTSCIFEADSETIILVAVYTFSIVAKSMDVIRNRFTSLVQNEYVVKSEISRTVIGVCIKLILLWLKADIVIFVAAMAFDFVLLAAGYLVSYKSQIGKISQWKYDSKYAKYLLKEAFPLLLTSAAVFVYQRIDQVMIGNLVDKEAVGYFATASRFVEILMFFPQILTHTISPILIRIRKDDVNAYQNKAKMFMNITLWGMMILAIVLSISAYWIIMLTFGDKYIQAVPILAVLSFKVVAFALSTTAGSILVLEGLQKWSIIRDLFGCIVCVLLNFIFLPKYGAIAAAYIAIASLICAGYIGDAIVPAYHHIFKWQTNAIIKGWMDLVHIKTFIKRK